MPRPLRSTLFPYTTLFRSHSGRMGTARGRRRACGIPGTPFHLSLDRASQCRHRLERPGPMKDEKERSEEHTSELQSHVNLVCRLLLEKKKTICVVISPETG